MRMNGLRHKKGLLAMIVLILAGCQQEPFLDIGNVILEGKQNQLILQINTQITKGQDEQDAYLEDALVLVYKEGSKEPVRHLYGNTGDAFKLLLPDGTWRFMILGNLHREPENLDLDAVQNMSFSMDSLRINRGLPMSLDSVITIDGDKTLALELRQILSKVNAHITIPSGLIGAEIRSVQVKAASKYASYFENVEGSSTKRDLDVVMLEEDTRTTDVLVYVPEQKPGSASEIVSQRQRTLGNAPKDAAYLDVRLRVPETGRIYAYKLPLGGRNVSDFNLLRGTSYEMNVSIDQLETDDPREETWALNCGDSFADGAFVDDDGAYYTAMNNAKLLLSTDDSSLKSESFDIEVKLLKGDASSFKFNSQSGKTSYELSGVKLSSGTLELPIAYSPSLFTNANGNLEYLVSITKGGEVIFEKLTSLSFYNHLSVYSGVDGSPELVGGSVAALGAFANIVRIETASNYVLDVFNREGDIVMEASSTQYDIGNWYSGIPSSGTIIGSGSRLSYTFTSTESSIYHKFLPK